MRDVMLVLHFIGLAMALGTGFANFFLGIASSKLPPEQAQKFSLHALALTMMGHTGLGLLIVSGGYLMTPYWKSLGQMPLLTAKLVLVLVLIVLVSVLTAKGKKAKKGDVQQFAKIKPIGQMTLLTALVIVTLAVLVFH
jgi:hypothetical protein